jgi:hypothetical protein
MTTKKADTTKKTKELERGRFARILASGFVIEVTPSKKRSTAAATKPTPAAPKA